MKQSVKPKKPKAPPKENLVADSVKIAHVADIHIGNYRHSVPDPKTGMESRLFDYEKSWLCVCRKAVEEKVDAFLVAGDLFEKRNPTSSEMRVAKKGLEILRKASVPVVIIPGNHDVPVNQAKANSVEVFDDRPYVYVASEPEMIELDRLLVCCIPWISRAPLSAEKLRGLSIEEVNAAVKRRYFEEINALRAGEPGKPRILLAHFTAQGSVFPSGQEVELSLPSEVIVPLKDYPEYVYYALGHIHKAQSLLDDKAEYSGSIERADFGEENEEKGFLLVGIDKAIAKSTFIPIPARKFVTLTDIQDKSDIRDAIVRVKLRAESGQTLDRLAIRRDLYARGAFYVADISIEIADKKIRRNASLTESLTPQEALKQFCEENEEFEKHEVALVLLLDELAKEI